MGIKFHQIIGQPQIYIKITDAIFTPCYNGVGNDRTEFALVQIALLQPYARPKGKLVQDPWIRGELQVVGIGELYPCLGMVAVRIVEYDSPNPVFFTDTRVKVQRLE